MFILLSFILLNATKSSSTCRNATRELQSWIANASVPRTRAARLYRNRTRATPITIRAARAFCTVLKVTTRSQSVVWATSKGDTSSTRIYGYIYIYIFRLTLAWWTSEHRVQTPLNFHILRINVAIPQPVIPNHELYDVTRVWTPKPAYANVDLNGMDHDTETRMRAVAIQAMTTGL